MRGRHSDRLNKLERHVLPPDSTLAFQRAVRHNYNRKYISDVGLTAAILFPLAGREVPDWVAVELDRPIPSNELSGPEYKAAVTAARDVNEPLMQVEELSRMLQPILIKAFKWAGLDPDSEGALEKCLEFYSRKACVDVH